MKLRLEWHGNPVNARVIDVETGKEICVRRIKIDLGYGDGCDKCSIPIAECSVLLCDTLPHRWVSLDSTQDIVVEAVADTPLAATVDRLTE